MKDQVLFPKIEVREKGFLQVSDIHTIYWERSGNPNGKKILVIHGGPGGGSQPRYRRYFDPDKFDIIQFDQRGCGSSTPFSELKENTTNHLVDDIEKLRIFLKIDTWHLFGGSWGSTLSLIYAIKNPSRVTSLTLRGIFLCRKFELLWFYQYGASEIFPDEFEEYISVIPKEERNDLISSFYKYLTSSDANLRSKAAAAWTKWELSTSHLISKKFDFDKSEIRSSDASTLNDQAAWLKRYPNVTIVVEGHCDERGTREYNLALGERRANAVKEYLASRGISANRIDTISYGKERPAVLGSNESAWQQNRRGVSVIRGGTS